jgi:hypothetical protein
MKGWALGVCLLLWAATGGAQDQPQEPAPEPAAAPSGTTATPAPDPALTAIQAELARMREQLDQFEAVAVESQIVPVEAEEERLRIFGFMDFGLDKFFLDDPDDDGLSLLRPTPATTFVFGNLNIYFDAIPLDHLHAMVEIRFSLAPHGEEVSLGPPLGTSYERVDAVAFDFSSPSLQSQLRLGSIYIERAWTEYTFSPLFKLQWGLFLTPFGIWNLDHGSPVLISLMLPTFIASQMVPTRLLGLHLYGSAFFGAYELGYALHVSNGRSPIDYDLTEDKALGARIFLTRDSGSSRITLGASGYIGTYVDQEKRINQRPDGNLVDTLDVVDYDEEVLGLDVALDVGDLRVRSEAVLRWMHYEDGKHERVFTYDGTEQYLPNRLEIDAYVLAAYRTPWRVEPYVQVEVTDKAYVLPRYAGDSRSTTAGLALLAMSFGFNIELTPYTLFKFQVARLTVNDKVTGQTDFETPFLFVRVVSSF